MLSKIGPGYIDSVREVRSHLVTYMFQENQENQEGPIAAIARH